MKAHSYKQKPIRYKSNRLRFPTVVVGLLKAQDIWWSGMTVRRTHTTPQQQRQHHTSKSNQTRQKESGHSTMHQKLPSWTLLDTVKICWQSRDVVPTAMKSQQSFIEANAFWMLRVWQILRAAVVRESETDLHQQLYFRLWTASCKVQAVQFSAGALSSKCFFYIYIHMYI